jgi:iron(III) transport system permease protein
LLILGTLALALPVGVAGAVLLYRTDLPGRRLFLFLVLLTLFIPLPLFASGWQAILGAGGLLPAPFWNPVRSTEVTGSGLSWSPWGQGLGSAIWIHAQAALPWVILLVGQGLQWVEPELEEDALLSTSPGRVLLRVTLPRARAAIAAAAVWTALQTATEITVTDVMRVRTFAEEVYTQMVAPERSVEQGESRALAVALPSCGLLALLILLAAQRWQRNLPAGLSNPIRPVVFRLGRWRWAWSAVTAAALGLYLGLPAASLVWRAGWQPGAGWSVRLLWRSLVLAAHTDGRLLAGTLLAAAAAGLLTAALAWLACWAALDSTRARRTLLVLLAVAWAWPGPVVGLGLKALLNGIVSWEDTLVGPAHETPDLKGGKDVGAGAGAHLLKGLLWDGPSLAPLIWVDLIRFFPCAVALLWPVMRLLPRDLRESARVEGASPGQELTRVVWPLTARPVLRAALAVAVLALGELSASKVVSTPGQPSFAETVFTQMHFGVTNALAARCLLLLLLVALGGTVVGVATGMSNHHEAGGSGGGAP